MSSDKLNKGCYLVILTNILVILAVLVIIFGCMIDFRMSDSNLQPYSLRRRQVDTYRLSNFFNSKLGLDASSDYTN